MSRTPTPRVPVVILCGGQGIRLREQTERRPKPMIEIAGRPMLWHLMRFYASHGFNDFVLCLGYLGDVIKRYFLDFAALESDFTVDLSAPGKIAYHHREQVDWRVTCVDTGAEAMTGARLARVARYLECDDFMLTYGDGLADVDLGDLLAFHRAHGRLATVTGVRPPGRFGELQTDTTSVVRFREKPVDGARINGGFFVFKRRFLDHVRDDDACVLERDPLERVAHDGELQMFAHDGFWQCLDTYRDLLKLELAWNGGDAPWRGS